ncbi:MAG: CoA activase [Deltaproteobacteria bacterium]|nr:CoA activase [Deltaproteobacteria bacterium]
MSAAEIRSFQSLSDKVGQFNLKGKTVLIPDMNNSSCRLMAAVFRSFGINALVMETFKGLDLGLEYSSGKECFPCQVTLGDILYHMKSEQEKKGKDFNINDYIYFLVEAGGPCRFGMYNKYQRIVLDSFPKYRDLKIGSITTDNGYSLDGLIDKKKSVDLRKSCFFSLVISDILDRLRWRIRPYEKEKGLADELIEKSIISMESEFEKYAAKKGFDSILEKLDEIVREAKLIIDHNIPPKPLIGIVGEIYLRTHVRSNQDLIRTLEKYGAEVVNASIIEWVNFISYRDYNEEFSGLRLNLKQLRFREIANFLKKALKYRVELFYQEMRQKKVYDRINSILDIAGDHKVGHLEDILNEEDLFNFELGTEACLSIAGILEYAREGYNGVVNVYPFTCMPSTTTSAIITPVMNKMGVPYLDTPYDSSIQPGREAAIRTFMYQAKQHHKRNGRTSHSRMASS